ncbi:hypothetical protein I8748_30745 [Nostoc sp. CENA67]|uniref:Uncharacterized protein n=1 Tax=Amazonocrinis nigriterrae CENA67 TaxID=2794033 RepID=A0A8J7LE86_9NOST|nr:hypothetical protein [Amazonocrinis nigriterrae]MBH8566481.1 hypothetical protein [Amazonocrinis nigriterrae CENA67]
MAIVTSWELGIGNWELDSTISHHISPITHYPLPIFPTSLLHISLCDRISLLAGVIGFSVQEAF